MYYVYILYSRSLQKKYIGYTGNLSERLALHKKGSSPFTSAAKDWQLIYYEVFGNKKDAMAEETFLKSGKGRDRLRYLLKETMAHIRKNARAA